LENSIVTLDAMGCQTAIAEQILARGADDLLASLLPPWRSAAGRL
jgi:predicted transposase YbfD/YdcC